MTEASQQRDIFSVSRLSSELRHVLEGSFPLLWVEGEISNLASPRSGHLYFTLKDANAQIRCALFRNKRTLLRFQPGDGQKVLARARISFFEPRGDCQLIIEHLEPAGAGSLQLAFEALKKKLQAEGLFAAERKQPLPAFPQRIGVITSPSGAAIRDVLNVLARRAPHLPVIIYPALVQGSNAADDLLEMLALALARRDCDVLLLTRGGGSIEDLAAFNDERLARAIAAADLPVVSAVGHEIDFTIADFVADRRAPTPSAAAELLSPDSQALRASVDKLRQRMQMAMQRRLSIERQHLERLVGRVQRAAPATRLRQQQQRLDSLDLRLTRNMQMTLSASHQQLAALGRRLHTYAPGRRLVELERRFRALPIRLQQAWDRSQRVRQERLGGIARQLNTVSPLATLERGYSVLRSHDDARVISSVDQVSHGQTITALLADGRLSLTVDEIGNRGLAVADDTSD